MRLLVLTLATVAASAAPAAAQAPVDFQRDVRPLLSHRCFACHGPDANEREAHLRLDTADGPDGAYRVRKGTAAIVPGDLAASAVWQRVTTDDEDERMPPAEAGHLAPFDAAELDVLRRWIEAGATYAGHWAFEPPTAPPLPAADDWSEQPIDRFVKARLDAEGLQPSVEADRRTLIRRVTFDLTGLPPTTAELAAFVADDRPDAYERLVDRLLQSPHYGEHMARYWLDLVRFADTNGMHHDHYRDLTPYRDWVIRAFNDNLPYDTFVDWQLAGDLYEDASQEQLIASGWHRLHLIIDVGTALPEESHARNVIDRVTAFGTDFLGLTVQCAQCHDHKFDPVTQRDFYRLAAFFNNLDGRPETGNRSGPDFHRGTQPPYLEMPNAEQAAQLAALDAQLTEVDESLATEQARLDTELEQQQQALGIRREVVARRRAQLDQRRVMLLAALPGTQLASGLDDAQRTALAELDAQIEKLSRPKAASKRQQRKRLGTLRRERGALLAPLPAATLQPLLDERQRAEFEVHALEVQALDDELARIDATLAKAASEHARLRGDRTKAADTKRRQLRRERNTIVQTVPAAMVMRERSEPRETHVFVRGQYDQPGERVERGVPAFLPPLAATDPDAPTRRDLAAWLLRADHPLTARVAVNRFWQQCFGVGLVKTSEDFGAQGEAPSHAALLDHLATTFVASGWDVKTLMRRIVCSRTYRQSSAFDDDAANRDPDNRLLGRGARFRMDAEMIRDQVLVSSGLWNPQMFGRSVKPPQPPGIWKAVTLPDSLPRVFVADEGDQVWRRSVYTFWKRGLPPPQMTILNAPSREYCTARRERTNTPLQALLLLNEEQYLKAARHLAQATLGALSDDDRRIEHIYEAITSHLPDDGELRLMRDALADLRILYRDRPALAAELAGDSDEPTELAAWTMLASTIYNLDITRTRQ